jgi:hypothetical protein
VYSVTGFSTHWLPFQCCCSVVTLTAEVAADPRELYVVVVSAFNEYMIVLGQKRGENKNSTAGLVGRKQAAHTTVRAIKNGKSKLKRQMSRPECLGHQSG